MRIDGELASIARSWSFTMADAGEIFHRSDLRAGVSSLWLALGENVGVGPGVEDLMNAFVSSPGHYKNIVDARFTHMGIGAVRAGGLIFTAHEFMKLDGAPGEPAPASGPPPARVTQTTAAPRPPASAPAPAPKRVAAAPKPGAAAPAPVAPVAPPPPLPPPAATPDRLIEMLDRLRGNPPAL